MPAIKLTNFRGLLPKADKRNLPAGFAQVAENVRFDAGDLAPIRSAEGSELLSGDIGNIFYLRDDQSGGEPRFISFGESMDVTFARGPEPGDQHRRFYWCVVDDDSGASENGLRAISDPLNNPTPAYGASSTGEGLNFRQFSGYRVGIPAPATAPVAENDTPPIEIDFGGVTELSRTSPITVTASASVPFEAGMRVRIVIDPSLPTGEEQEEPAEEGEPPGDEAEADSTVGRLWSLDGLEGTVGGLGESGTQTFTIIGASAANLGTEDLTSEEQAAIKIEQVLTDLDYESRGYVYTYVSEFDEEGPPSPPSNLVNTVTNTGRVSLDLGDVAYNLSTMGGDRRNINRIRIYRQVTGSNFNSAYLFVDDIAFPDANPELSWNTTYLDTKSPQDLGEVLPSEKWFPPPLDLQGIHMMPNGFMVGWRANELWFSEPYLPHAWNQDYRRTVDNDIIGVESYGSTVVIGTRGRPYIASGSDPASMTLRKVPVFAPLVNPLAMVDAGSGVMYPSTTGLWLINQNGAQNLTKNHYDAKTWEQISQDLKKGIYHDERIIFFGRWKTPLMIDFNGEGIEVSHLKGSHYYSAGCIADSDLALVRALNPDQGSFNNPFRRVVFFKSSNIGNTETLRWRSGLLTLDKHCNMAVCQVFASGYPVTVGLAIPPIVNGQPDYDNMVTHTQTIEGPEPVRLPSDYLSREYEVIIEGDYRIQMVMFASTMDEVRAA